MVAVVIHNVCVDRQAGSPRRCLRSLAITVNALTGNAPPDPAPSSRKEKRYLDVHSPRTVAMARPVRPVAAPALHPLSSLSMSTIQRSTVNAFQPPMCLGQHCLINTPSARCCGPISMRVSTTVRTPSMSVKPRGSTYAVARPAFGGAGGGGGRAGDCITSRFCLRTYPRAWLVEAHLIG